MCSKFLFALFIFFLAAPIFPSNSITLYGGAFLNAASIALSKEKNFTFLPLPLFFPPAPPPLFRAISLSPSTCLCYIKRRKFHGPLCDYMCLPIEEPYYLVVEFNF
ncbi:adenylate kinase domain-containing protein 1 [Striga asiatica]|uniref:Adenylate kinase domain-containing protein 1 n=1 Tax=Striga asiatica TaxID=4170 RepID=A0A5A7RDC8_STRAF|nr:adenylate kinase domain-containing protein 1 [Striga asiatica]